MLTFLIILNKGLHIFCSHQPCKFCRHPDYLQNENGNPASLISMKWPVLKTHQGTWHTELRVTILNLSHRTTKTNGLVGPRLYFVRKTDGGSGESHETLSLQNHQIVILFLLCLGEIRGFRRKNLWPKEEKKSRGILIKSHPEQVDHVTLPLVLTMGRSNSPAKKRQRSKKSEVLNWLQIVGLDLEIRVSHPRSIDI